MLKFNVMVRYESPEAAQLWQSTSGQIQDGRRRPNFQSLSRYN